MKTPVPRAAAKEARPVRSTVNASQQTLRSCVTTVLGEYFEQVDEEMITDLYAMVLSEVEAPLLEAVMRKARSNQCRAALMLGLNRGTLRKKLKQYGILE